MTIYFLASDTQQPFGGVRKIYDFVDHLNVAGIEAFVVHSRRGFRCSWFPNSTPVIEASAVRVSTADLLVLTEFRAGRLLDRLPSTVPKVLFIQAPYIMFRDFPLEPRGQISLFNRDDVLGAVVVSEDSARYVSQVLPEVEVRRVRLGIDQDVYFPNPGERNLDVAFAPRKRPTQTRQVLYALHHRGALDGWGIRPINGASSAEVAATLQRSALYLSFAHPDGEGFSLLALEAMACGCLVIGQTGGGGDEFFRREFSFPVPDGSTSAMTELAEQVLTGYRERRGHYEAMANAGSDFVRGSYTPQQEREDVVAAFSAFLEAAGPASSKTVGRLDLSELTPAHRLRRVMYYLKEAARAAVSDADMV